MADKNIELILKCVRVSFLNVFEVQEFVDEKNGQKRYSYNGNSLIPKTINEKGEYDPKGSRNPVVKVVNDAVKAALLAAWPDGKKVIPPDRRCLRDGEPIDPDTIDPDIPGSGTRVPLYEGYAGHVFISANRSVDGPDSPNPIQLLGPKKTAKKDDGTPCFPRLKKSDGLLYSGCYADVIIRIYGYDGKGKNPDRINASLEAIKFVRHGEAFGAKPVDADAAFDEEDSDDDVQRSGGAAAADDDIG